MKPRSLINYLHHSLYDVRNISQINVSVKRKVIDLFRPQLSEAFAIYEVNGMGM